MKNTLPPLLPPPLPPRQEIDHTVVTLYILTFVMIAVIVFGTYKAYDYGDECKNLIEYADRSGLYDANNNPSNYGKVTGVYFVGKNYYCVYTKDRSPWEINMTDMHEGCHDFVYQDPVHFCNNSCEKIGYSLKK